MFQPRRLRTLSPSSVETSARKPSHFSSKDHPEPEGRGPGRDNIGSGSRSVKTLASGLARLGVGEERAYWRPRAMRASRSVRSTPRSSASPVRRVFERSQQLLTLAHRERQHLHFRVPGVLEALRESATKPASHTSRASTRRRHQRPELRRASSKREYVRISAAFSLRPGSPPRRRPASRKAPSPPRRRSRSYSHLKVLLGGPMPDCLGSLARSSYCP
jgi:hypothetical protein